jgi:predicted AAA+ superfamily ATPase
MSPETILPRFIEETVRERLEEEPVIVLNGARTVGKSTLLRRLAGRLEARVHDLDDLPTREAVAADPAFFASGPSPVLVDEFQHVLDLLDAIKAELNRNLRPGRFVLTGSTRYMTLPAAAQSLTGRVHVMRLWPFSQGELRQGEEAFLEALVADPASVLSRSRSETRREEYAERILTGGFPLAVRRERASARGRWFADFVNLVIERDVLEIRRVRQREVLPRLLRRLAAQTAQILNVAKAARQVAEGLDASVAGDFTKLLETVFLVHRLPAWGRTLRSHVNALPKIHLTDSGLAGHLLGIGEDRLASRDPAALTDFGHLAETFAVNEILKQASWSELPARFGHFHTHDGAEVDLVVEIPDGRVAGVEVKASGRVPRSAGRGLRILRERLGSRFLGGVVLYLGERSYTMEDRIHVAPLDRLWMRAD